MVGRRGDHVGAKAAHGFYSIPGRRVFYVVPGHMCSVGCADAGGRWKACPAKFLLWPTIRSTWFGLARQSKWLVRRIKFESTSGLGSESR